VDSVINLTTPPAVSISVKGSTDPVLSVRNKIGSLSVVATGQRGPKGERGEKGDKGDASTVPGPQGIPGLSIKGDTGPMVPLNTTNVFTASQTFNSGALVKGSLTIDQGNITNANSLYIGNVGAGETGIYMARSGGGGFSIGNNSGAGNWGFVSTNRTQAFNAINGGFDASPHAFLFQNQDAPTRAVMRLRQNNANATGDLLQATTSTNAIVAKIDITGKVWMNAMNLTPGPAPSSPANGDLWGTTAGLFVRSNGTTIQLMDAAWPFLNVTNDVPYSILNNTFDTLRLPTVVTDSAAAFNTSTNIYTVPVSGVYDISLKFRLTDSTASGISYGLGVGPTNADSAQFSWYVGAPVRSGALYRRTSYFAAGTLLRAFAYYAGNMATNGIFSSDLTILRVR
jgi:hypothetical protein